jgi:hypothetical protein
VLPPVLVTADEGTGDLVMLNDTLTEALLLVFSVAAGSELGSGFSVTYGSTSEGLRHLQWHMADTLPLSISRSVRA